MSIVATLALALSMQEQAAPQPGRLAPPFVPVVGAAPADSSGTTGVMPAPYHAGGRQFLVQPGQYWQHLVEDLEPGDEVVLPAGFHAAQVIKGLRGSPDRPIFIRSRDRVPAAFACGDEGLVLRNCRHVVLENVLFINPTNAAVTIDADAAGRPGEPWMADVLVRFCTVQGNAGAPEQDAIRVRGVADVKLDSIRVESWKDAAIEVVDSSQVLVRALMTVPGPVPGNLVGVSVLGSSSRIAVTGCVFNKSIGTGVRIGGRAQSTAGSPLVPVRTMRVDRCIMEEPGTGFEFVAADDLTVSRATIVNPSKAMYSIASEPGPLRLHIEHCLGYWTPGAMARFSPHPEQAAAGSITLGPNLWYSKELPTAWQEIGQPFGVQVVTQVTNLDPGLDVRDLRPRNEGTTQFGAYSANEGPAPAAGPPLERTDQIAPPLLPPTAP